MKLVDTNVLVYAVDRRVAHHDRSRIWLDATMASRATVLLPWVSLVGFVRITTHPRIHPHPLSPEAALTLVDEWLAHPQVITPEPDPRHTTRMRELLEAAGSTGGNLVNDAHLAALALQYGATVVTFDNDFGRFPGVKWEMPGA